MDEPKIVTEQDGSEVIVGAIRSGIAITSIEASARATVFLFDHTNATALYEALGKVLGK